MKNEFLLAITQLAAERNLPKELVFKAVETALGSTYRKDESIGKYDIAVAILPASGEIKVYAQKVVTEAPTDEWHEISLADARKIQKDINQGETIKVEIHPPDAGRIGVQTAKQVVMQRLREAEREFIFGTFAHREGEILAGVIQQMDHRQIIVDLGKADGVLPIAEQVRTEHYRVGQRLKVYLLEVSQTTKGPRLLLSRTHANLVKRLFELEVPEITSGVVELKAIAREPGSRTKIAVAAKQEEVDPVGSCIGLRGIRIQNIISELQGEKVDVIKWDRDTRAFIANALSPAQTLNVIINHEEIGITATVIVPDGQLSLAIGREGQNARLAARLTNSKIDIKSASTVAATEMLPPIVEEITPAEAVEEAEEEVEDIVLVEEVVAKRPPVTEGPQIRFAEDILPKAVRATDKVEKGKKKYVEQKPKSTKKAKLVKLIEDEDGLEDILEDKQEDDLSEGFEDNPDDK
ncbi:MAG: transcription termination factor NusA [Dehalococcoidia bacterium]